MRRLKRYNSKGKRAKVGFCPKKARTLEKFEIRQKSFKVFPKPCEKNSGLRNLKE
jgi:hypothetical protein